LSFRGRGPGIQTITAAPQTCALESSEPASMDYRTSLTPPRSVIPERSDDVGVGPGFRGPRG
ncbi:MAG TPA: hypothetical protein PLQ80_03210, partial [Candidatus Syntrophosphaera sp.]|nr:hypothetical protein [Candidatus Syntrophosphaera sp.]